MPKHTAMSAAFTLALLVPLTPAIASAQSAAPAASATEDDEALGGIWELNRDVSRLSGSDTSAGSDGSRGGEAGGGGGRVLVGRGGGGGVRIGGPGGTPRAGDPEQMRAIVNYMQTLNEPAERLTIVVRDRSVGITVAEGRTEMLQTDNRKVESRAENGLVKLTRRSRWDGRTLVSEIAIDNGPRIRRKYELSADGTELHISTEIGGGPGGGMGRGRGAREPSVLVYDRQTHSMER